MEGESCDIIVWVSNVSAIIEFDFKNLQAMKVEASWPVSMGIRLSSQRAVDNTFFTGYGTEFEYGILLAESIFQCFCGDHIRAGNIGKVAGVHISFLAA